MSSSLIKYFIFSTLFFFLVEEIVSQIHFTNYDYTNGLPLDEITTIKEDNKGYLWLGGASGLSRFDGNRFIHYHLGNEAFEVAGNVVHDIGITPNGRVVIVYDDNGISVYNHETDSFRSKKYLPEDSLDFPEYSLFFVEVLTDSTAYIGGTVEGLYHINLNSFKSRKIPIDFIPNDMIPDPINKGQFLLTNRGLHRFNPIDNSIQKVTGEGFAGLQVSDENVWYYGYFRYIYKYNLKSNTETKYKIEYGGRVRSWTRVDDKLWAATAEGLEIIDIEKNKVETILRAGAESYDLKGNLIYEIFKDKQDRIWVATNGGLSLYDPEKAYFSHSNMFKEQSTDLVELTSEEKLSIDFYNNTVFRVNHKNEVKSIDIVGKLNQPVQVIEHEQETLIQFFNGIGVYDKSTNTVVDKDCPFTRLKTRGLIDLLVTDRMWLGIYRYSNQLIVWNKPTNTIDTFNLKTEPRGIIKLNDGAIWIYGHKLLVHYNLDDNNVNSTKQAAELIDEIGGDIVAIKSIPDTIWFAARFNGMWRANYKNENFYLQQKYDKSNGLSNNKIEQIYLDEFDNLFVQSRSNISVFDNDLNRFHTLGGTQNVNMQLTYGLTTIDSIVYALGYKSQSLDLRKANLVNTLSKFNIEKVLINGKKSIWSDEEVVRLDPSENNISLYFSIIEFGRQQNIKSRYRLNNDDEWIYLDPLTRSIHLNALAAGEYVMDIEIIDSHGQWNNVESFRFLVEKYFWRTWWFLLLCISALVLIFIAIYKWRMNHIKKVNNIQLQLAELEGESLRAQMNPHFIFNALNSIKAYIIKSEKEDAADYLTTFSELMRAVLRNSKEKEVSLNDELEALNLYLQIEKIRLNNKFDYFINIEESIKPKKIAFPPLIIQPFVENSIWHGFINKNSQGVLNIEINENNGFLKVEVIDNGIGREASRIIEKSRVRKRSYGISITENRLQKVADETEIQVIDLYDKDGKGSGTKVIIKLPIKHKLNGRNQIKSNSSR